MKWLLRLWKGLLRDISIHPVAGGAALFLAGVIFWGGFNWSLELTNTEQFCISCHVMENNVYKEYKHTIHYANRTGVRASCPDCHVPRDWIHKVVRKVNATNELFHWMAGSIDTPEKFEAKRPELARHVWDSMIATDSRECRNCHDFDSMSAGQQTSRTYIMHVMGENWGTTCIECHQGIVHTLPRGFDKEAMMDELHVRMEEEKVNCIPCHKDMVVPPSGQGW
jgi:cytochrome c-type protein NapC